MSERRPSVKSDQEPTFLQDEPVRRYTYGGRVAHLLAFTTDFGAYPYATAFCGYTPEWGVYWLGSGSQREEEEADRLRTCKRCNKIARETGDFVSDLFLFGKPRRHHEVTDACLTPEDQKFMREFEAALQRAEDGPWWHQAAGREAVEKGSS